MFRLTGVVRDSDAQVAHFGELIPDDRVFIAPSFTWRPDDNTTFTVLTDFQHDKTGNAFTVPVAKTVGNKLGGTILDVYPLPLWTGDPTFNRFDQEQFRVGYQFEHRFNEMFTVRQGLRYGEVDLDYRYLLPLNGIPLIEGSTTKELNRESRAVREATKSFTVDNQLETKAFTGAIRHTFITGLDYQLFQLDSTTLKGKAPSLNSLDPVYGQPVQTPTNLDQSAEQDASQTGIYVQDQAKLDNWILTMGGRYDWANLDSVSLTVDQKQQNTIVVAHANDEAFTGRAGLTYLFDIGLAPYVSYSESFLPTMGVDKNSNPFVPTTGQQYEAGIKYEPLGTRSRFTLAAFDLTQQNVLTLDPTKLTAKIQTGEIRSRGIEAEATVSLSDALQLIATYTLMDIEVTKSTPAQKDLAKVPILTPEEMASIFADYTFQYGPLAGFGFGAGVRYIGETYMDPANTLTNDAYMVVDAALHYTYKDMTWALNVSNLFNRDEAICTTSGGCQFISPQIVRTSVRYRW
jgi:iron complex outermembrane receptor protein